MSIGLPAGALTLAVRTALDEDLGAEGDPTSRLLGARAEALLVARGPGVVSYAEPGLGRATVSDLSARAARVFTRGNAVLALDGPPPAGLSLDLPAGLLLGPPSAVPCETDFPAVYRDAPGGVIVSGVLPLRAATR